MQMNFGESLTFFIQSEAYAKKAIPIEKDLRMEAIRGIFNGTKRLYVEADFVKELREVIIFKRKFDIPKLTIVGGEDAWMVADLLNENGISVMIGRVDALPRFCGRCTRCAFHASRKACCGEGEILF